MEVQNFAEKNKSKVANIVILVVAGIVAFNIFNAQVRMVNLLKQQKADETSKNEVLQNISLFERRLSVYKKLLPRKDPNAMINTVSSIANSLKIKIASIRPAVEQNSGEYSRIPFDLNINVANYHLLGNFIGKLENHSDAFSVDSVEIDSSGQDKELAVHMVVSSIAMLE